MKAVVRNPGPGEPGYDLSVTSARGRCRLLLHVFHQFHRLHSEQGQMINATAINAVPVLEEVYAGTTQEWSLRLNLTQHGETHQVTHQVLTHSKDSQIHSSFLTQWIVVHGRSSLMESVVWLIPFLCVKRREKREERRR